MPYKYARNIINIIVNNKIKFIVSKCCKLIIILYCTHASCIYFFQ